MQICIVSARGIFVNRVTMSKEHIIRLPVFRFSFFLTLVNLNESFKTGSSNIAKPRCADLIIEKNETYWNILFVYFG